MSDTKPAVTAKQLGAVVVVLVIAIAGYFSIRQWFQPPTQPDVDVGRTVVEQFLSAVRKGNAGAAWDATSTEFKSVEGRESFIRKTKSMPILAEPLQFNSTQQVLVQDKPRTEYLFQSPKAKMVRVLLGYERGEWKVDRLAF